MDSLKNIDGIRAEFAKATPELDEFESATPRVYIYLEGSWSGLGHDEIIDQLANDNPSIRVLKIANSGWLPQNVPGIMISPVNLLEGEPELIASRLREILTPQI